MHDFKENQNRNHIRGEAGGEWGGGAGGGVPKDLKNSRYRMFYVS